MGSAPGTCSPPTKVVSEFDTISKTNNQLAVPAVAANTRSIEEIL
jgi:hypothetical protein